MTNCSRKDCQKKPTKKPMISFRGKGTSEKSPRIRMVIDFPICDEHAVADVNFFVGDDGWKFIEDGIRRSGFLVPDRESVQVWFMPLKNET